jgi:hypothetical protein
MLDVILKLNCQLLRVHAALHVPLLRFLISLKKLCKLRINSLSFASSLFDYDVLVREHFCNRFDHFAEDVRLYFCVHGSVQETVFEGRYGLS